MSDGAKSRRGVGLALLAVLLLVPLLARLGGESHILGAATRVVVFAIAALSLDLILGFGAMVSFGHAAFLGIGAYAVGILSAHGIEDLLIQTAAALLAAAVFAAVTGAISLRTSGVYFIMITLAFAQMLYFFAISLAAYGGDDGIGLASRSTIAGFQAVKSPLALYALSVATLVGCVWFCHRLIGSWFGRVLVGTRENAERMRAIGFEPYRYQLAAYVLSGMICALAGVLLANQTEFVSPAYMAWHRSGELLVMVILGGAGTLYGAVIGAAAFLMLEDVLSGWTEHWKMIFGPLLILVVLFGRGGISGVIGRLGGTRSSGHG